MISPHTGQFQMSAPLSKAEQLALERKRKEAAALKARAEARKYVQEKGERALPLCT
jgi:hypothetical protein